MDTDLPLYQSAPYKFYLVPEFDENTSYMIFIINHAWNDGV